MCGIFCCCSCCFGDTTVETLATGPLGRRGPDRTHLQAVAIPSTSSTAPSSLNLAASVLHHRGPFTPQPLCSASEDLVLLWNGEIFDGLDVASEENDTRCLLNALEAAGGSEEALFAVLASIRGPFAFALLHRPSASLLFGRDSLGRRSLLVGRSKRDHLHLCSVLLPSSPPETAELPPIGLFRLRLSDGQLLLRPWDFAANIRAGE